jgi:hypothetical protein
VLEFVDDLEVVLYRGADHENPAFPHIRSGAYTRI